MKIVVIGGTGLIGSKTVAILRQRGHEVVAASPNTGVNSLTGEGLKEAMAGAQVVIDLANSPSFEDKAVLSRLPSFVRPARKRLRTAAGLAACLKNAASADAAWSPAWLGSDRKACSPDGTTNGRGAWRC